MNVGSFDTIPTELRSLRQWVCCKANKNLYQVNGQQASTDNPATWNTFEACLAAVGSAALVSIGFVLTKDDPYFIIDLDKTASEERRGPVHMSIHDDFDSYSEISISGTGCHIVGKGTLNGMDGFKNPEWGVECYSSGRYIVFTGNIYNQKPIAERQELLDKLQQAFRPIVVDVKPSVITPTAMTDEEVVAKICSASNGDTFKSFYKDGYPDGSDRSSVDIAFMNFMAFYSVGSEQALRLIKSSKLHQDRINGPKDKAKKFNRKDYLINTYNDAVNKPLQQIEPIDIGDYRNALANKLKAQAEVVAVPHSPITIPPGLVGKIARYAYDASPTPVAEIALCSALALMAGICGRSHSVSGTGLNLYLCMLSPSGTGKESGGKAVTTLMSTVKQQAPMANFIGPGEIVSGPALYKSIAANPCYLSILGEFGLTLQEMSSRNASSAQVSLRKMLLQMFNKSGPDDMLHPIVYSDKANNTAAVESPALSLLCDSAPEIFYDNLDESMIVGGLIPRFVFFEYTEFDPPYNHEHHKVKADNQLIQDLTTLSLQAISIGSAEFKMADLKSARRTMDVPISDDAAVVLEAFRLHVKSMMGNKELTRNLWNRAHVNAWKIAALVAIGENLLFPIISKENVEWATRLVELSCTNLAKKFASGEVGRNSVEIKQELQVERVIREYVTFPFVKVKGYLQKTDTYAAEKMHYDKIVPNGYIGRRLGTLPIFQNDRIGGTNAIKRTVKNLVDTDRIREVPTLQLAQYGTRQISYVVNDQNILDNPNQ